ncbi:hypothetical protein [Sulfurimonas sp.]|uniref:hypothetical protein n=1 Tax=Sulfurimonas sp. TaxID=2022749 RepID=UPI003D133FFA
MDIQREFEKVKANVYKWHKKDKNEWFATEDNMGSEKERVNRRLNKLLTKEDPMYLIGLFYEDSFQWHINQAQHALLYHENQESYYQHIALGVEYYYLAILLQYKEQFLGMRIVSFTRILAELIGWSKESSEIAQLMIQSINQEDEVKLIEDGDKFYPAMWFTLDLYCKINNTHYDKEKADYPNIMMPYDEVLLEWDNEDLNRVDQLVSKMADLHVLRSRQGLKGDEEWEQEFAHREMQLFPLEILYWLQQREKQGLKNPEKFSHYLMQEPLAQMSLFDKKLPFPEIEHPELLQSYNEEVYKIYMAQREE